MVSPECASSDGHNRDDGTSTCPGAPLFPFRAGTFSAQTRSIFRHHKEKNMNSIVWLVGAVVIVIAVLNLVGFA
jgi:hypothetical protein